MPTRRSTLLLASTLLPAAGCSAWRPQAQGVEVAQQVREAETAFAATMAARDLQAFGRHIADDAVFINGGQPLRGKPDILAYWARFFTGAVAPFSWKPEIVEVAAGGLLGYTEGPVTSAAGRSAARFYSTWQRQADGSWRVVFDNGYKVCG